MFETFILPAISLGLSASALPGPLQAYLLNTTLTYGWRKGLLAVLSPLITDVPIIILMTFILQQLPDAILQLIRLSGGCLLLWIAWSAWKQFRAGTTLGIEAKSATIPNKSNLQILGTAVMMNFLSPGPYLFWGTVNGPLLLKALDLSLVHAAAFLVGFYGVFLSCLSLLVLVFHRLGQLNARVTRIIMILAIILLVWFGTALIAEAFTLTGLHRSLTWIAAILGGAWLAVRVIQAQRAPIAE